MALGDSRVPRRCFSPDLSPFPYRQPIRHDPVTHRARLFHPARRHFSVPFTAHVAHAVTVAAAAVLHRSVPQAVPHSVPRAVRHSVPRAVSRSVLGAVPRTVPEEVPRAVPLAVPRALQEGTSSMSLPPTPIARTPSSQSSLPSAQRYFAELQLSCLKIFLNFARFLTRNCG